MNVIRNHVISLLKRSLKNTHFLVKRDKFLNRPTGTIAIEWDGRDYATGYVRFHESSIELEYSRNERDIYTYSLADPTCFDELVKQVHSMIWRREFGYWY